MHTKRSQFPPHTRGCTVFGEYPGVVSVVSPAHAGMYRDGVRNQVGQLRFPRTRGDVPHIVLKTHAGPLVSPAHAGMYR